MITRIKSKIVSTLDKAWFWAIILIISVPPEVWAWNVAWSHHLIRDGAFVNVWTVQHFVINGVLYLAFMGILISSSVLIIKLIDHTNISIFKFLDHMNRYN